MKINHPQNQAVAKARINFLSAMFRRYSAISSSGIDVTEDDLATEIEAEVIAIAGSPKPESAFHPEPPQPPNSPAPIGAVAPFLRSPEDIPNAA
ncbi:MAG: hypothetical protein EBS01_06685 [Verrucomicrobia bacterium]|nr:hypothetical protein [Verrucomicrobiota bacterium]